jgi:hypothetical protein
MSNTPTQPTQLGVNDLSAIYAGGLANNPLFFGSSTAEMVSVAVQNGGWNGDRSVSVRSIASWFGRGHRSDYNASGVFAAATSTGVGEGSQGHRTILSGY